MLGHYACDPKNYIFCYTVYTVTSSEINMQKVSLRNKVCISECKVLHVTAGYTHLYTYIYMYNYIYNDVIMHDKSNPVNPGGVYS